MLPRGPIGDWTSPREAHRCEMPPVDEWTANYIVRILISITYLEKVHNSATVHKFERWQLVRGKVLNGEKSNQKSLRVVKQIYAAKSLS